MPPEPPESPHEGPEPEEREWSILSLTELWRDPLAHQGDPRISAVGGWLEPSDGEWVTVTNVDRSVMHSFRVFEVRCMSLYSQEQIPSFDKSGDGLVYYHLFLDLP